MRERERRVDSQPDALSTTGEPAEIDRLACSSGKIVGRLGDGDHDPLLGLLLGDRVGKRLDSDGEHTGGQEDRAEHAA